MDELGYSGILPTPFKTEANGSVLENARTENLVRLS